MHATHTLTDGLGSPPFPCDRACRLGCCQASRKLLAGLPSHCECSKGLQSQSAITAITSQFALVPTSMHCHHDPCPNPSLDIRPVALATASCIRSRPWRARAGCLGYLPAQVPPNSWMPFEITPQSRSSIEFMTVVRLLYDFLTCLAINGAFP